MSDPGEVSVQRKCSARPVQVKAEWMFLRELAERASEDCTMADDGALLMPMVNLEVEAHKGSHGTASASLLAHP